MSALPMIRTWREQVRDELLPDLHGHQAKALADLSFAMALVQHCHSGKVAAVAPGDTTPAATKRRLERLLANDRLDPETAWMPKRLAWSRPTGCGPPSLLSRNQATSPSAPAVAPSTAAFSHSSSCGSRSPAHAAYATAFWTTDSWR